MIQNIYSIKKFCEITEVPGAKLVEARVIVGKQAINTFGIGVDRTVNYGIYSPFWMPNEIETFTIEELDAFSKHLIEQSLMRGSYDTIKIRLPPAFYGSNVGLFKFQLMRHGFSVSNLAVWQAIDCSKYQSNKDYESLLKHSSRRVLNRFQENFHSECREVDPTEDNNLEHVHDMLNENRKQLGVSLKYTKEYLKKLASIAPDQIKLFEFVVGGLCVAVALCQKVADDILYVAAWGDARHDLPYSPMYTFSSELIAYCIKEKIDYLDFGISSALDLYTPGLFNFKKNIGCFYTCQDTLVLKTT
jgi:hypothetical protein